MLGRIDSNANGLRDSVILVDHPNDLDQNMAHEVIPSSLDKPFEIWILWWDSSVAS